MTTASDQLDLPYTPRQMFDLIADIEKYPCFVPHVVEAHIRQRRGNEWDVDQVVRVKMLRFGVSTHAVLDPPSHIRIACTDSRLGRFTEDWTFEEGARGGTRLKCVTAFSTSSGVLDRIAQLAFADIHRSTMQAFASRARALYGG